MKLISCYKQLTPDNLIAGGVGQGGGGYWQESVGVKLQKEIAKVLNAEFIQSPRIHGRDSFDRQDYDVPEGDFDIAYCQLFEVPKQRPAQWVYSIISDYISMEVVLEDFLARAKPDVLISFQYPLQPPMDKPNLVEQCARHGCRVVFMPWFNVENEFVTNKERDITAMCTGKMGGTYPFRDKAYKYLESLNRSDIVLSGNPNGSTFRLSDVEYQDSMRRCRYYVSGGIYDMQIPPKYYEVCNYGCCLISPELPMMKEAGFIDGLTYIKVNNVEEIPEILATDRWKRIGKQGQIMVQVQHNLQARARDIARLWFANRPAVRERPYPIE
jgi:hypothetical protein